MKNIYLLLVLCCLSVQGFATTYYNLASSNASLQNTSGWSTAVDGSGTTHPTNFTTAGDVFNLVNTGGSPTISAAWAITGVTLNVGNGTNAITLTIPSGSALSGTGTVNVLANATLTLANTTLPTLGTLSATSTVNYNKTSGSVVSATYGNLTLSNTTGTQTAGGTITVSGTLTTTSGGTFAMSTFQLLGSLPTVTNNGTITTSCTVNPAIPSGKNWTGSGAAINAVTFSSSGQSIPAGTYRVLSTGATATDSNMAVGTLSVTGTFSVTGTIDLETNVLSAGSSFNPTGSGTIRTANNTSVTPIKSGQTWALKIEYYNSTGGQAIVAGTYNGGLTNSNTSGKNSAVGAISVSGALTLNGASVLYDSSFTITLSGNISGSGKNTSSTNVNSKISMTGIGSTISGATLGKITLNSGTYSLTGDPTITDTLKLTSAVLTLGSNNLIMGASAPPVAGTFSSSNMIVANSSGQMRKLYSSNGSYVFPIGDNTPGYSPITLSFTGGTYGSGAYAGVKVTNSKHPNNANTNKYIKRYWSVSTSAITSPVYTLTATYIPGVDTVGAEGSISSARYTGSLPWIKYSGVSTSSHTISTTTVNSTSADFSGITTAGPSLAAILPSTASFCDGNNVIITDTANTGDAPLTYSWSPSTGLSATTGTSVTASPAVTGGLPTAYIYTLTVTDGNGFTSSAISAVTVNPAPGTTTGTATVCEGATTTLSNSVSGGTWTCFSSSAFVDASGGVVTGESAGTAVISYTMTGGCAALDTVTVNAQPASITGTTNVCIGYPQTMISSPDGGTWSSSDETTATVDGSGNTTGIGEGTADISYTLDGGCYVLQTISVNLSPDVISGPTSVFEDQTISLTDGDMSGNWTSDNTSVASVDLSSGIVTGLLPGTANIIYTLSGGCAATTQVTVGTQQPAITSLSPVIGFPGSSVTITGTNFSASPDSNIVYFGPVRATVTDASATSLTVNVPVGATYMPVTVNNMNTELTAYSPYPFLPSFDSTGLVAGLIEFNGRTDFITPVSTITHQVIMADIDGDGNTDMIVANEDMSSGTGSISVYRNISAADSIAPGSFDTRVDFAGDGSTAGGYSIGVGDLDGDGRPDIILGNSSSVTVFLNTSVSGTIDGSSFASPVSFSTSGQVNSIGIEDLDQDGKADIVAATGNIDVLHNSTITGSTLSFDDDVTFTVSGGIGITPNTLALADMDGDGKPEIIVASNLGSSVYVLQNICTQGTVTGGFADPAAFSTGSGTSGVATGDIDGDGYLDLLVSNSTGNTISVLRNNTTTIGSILFNDHIDFTTGTTPGSISVADFDGDEKPDMAVSCSGSISIFRNTSASGTIDGSSLTGKAHYIGDFSNIIAGDMTGDGKADLVAVKNGGNAISVYPNDPFTPLIVTYNHSHRDIGDSLTITGNNFDSVASNNIVYFGATRATISSASTTSITAFIPLGATYQSVTVNNTHGLTGYLHRHFLPTFEHSAYQVTKTNFDPKVDFDLAGGDPSVAQPSQVILSDIDGDGKVDMLVSYKYTSGGGGFSVYPNISTSGTITSGSFGDRVDFPLTYNALSIGVQDIDGDGKPDVVVGGDSISVFRNTSVSGSINSSSFDSPVDFLSGGPVSCIAIGDLDGDGKADIVVAPGYIFHNTATKGSITASSFSNAQQIVFSDPVGGTTVNSIAIADLDGDGRPEIAAVSSSGNNVYILGNTYGSDTVTSGFTDPVSYFSGSGLNSVILADIDKDGKFDLVVSNGTANTISVLRNTTSTPGTITFASNVDFTTASNPTSIAAADFNGDWRVDLAVTCGASNTVSIFRNATVSSGDVTSATFAARVDSATGSNPVSGAIADMDGDTVPDIVTANQGANTISILRNDPVLNPIAGNTLICAGTTTTLNCSPAGGTWSSTDSTIASVNSATRVVTGISAGTATISYIYTTVAGVTHGVAAVVSVNPTTIATVTGTTEVCASGGTTTLAAAPAGGTWSASTLAKASVDASGLVTGKAITGTSDIPAIITYTYVNSSGCTGKTFTTVTVHPLPAIVTIFSIYSSVCVGATIGLRDTSSEGVWSSLDPGIATVAATPSSDTGVVTGISAGTTIITYTLTSDAGCSVFRTKTITVNALPAVPAITTGPGNVCPGHTITLSESTTGGLHSWLTGDSSVATVQPTFGIVTGIAEGTVTISYKYTLVCVNYATAVVTINPVTTATVTGTPEVCASGGTTTLTGMPDGGTWSASALAKAAVDSTGLVTGKFMTGTTNGTATITYAYANTYGCVDKEYTIVTVDALPVAGIINGPSSVCMGSTINLTDTTPSGTWSSSDTSKAIIMPTGDGATGSVTPVAAGTTIISYTATSAAGCAGYKTKILTVNALPSVPDIGVGGAAVCPASAITLTETTTGGTHVWSSANTAVATINSISGIVTGIAAGTVTISYGYTLVCTKYAQAVITVNPATVPSVTGTAELCASGGTTTLSGSPDGGTWSNIVGAKATVNPSSGIVTGSISSGTAGITYSYTNTYGCNRKTNTIVTVDALPVVGVIGGPLSVCMGNTINLPDTTPGGTWTSSDAGKATVTPTGDGATGVITAVAPGTTTISYAVTGSTGCTGYKTKTVTVNALPAVPAITAGSGNLCPAGTLALSDSTTGGTHIWSSASTAVATINSTFGTITGIAPGTAVISYSYTLGCTNYAQTTVTVNSITVPAITGTAELCASGGTATLTGTPTGGAWSNATGAKATVGTSTGIVTGSITSGTALITYSYTNSHGCNGKTSTAVTVDALPVVGTIGGTGTVCMGSTANLTDTTHGGTWTSADAGKATIAPTGDGTTGIVTAVSPGTVVISYSAVGSTGCIGYKTKIVTVNALPTVNAISAGSGTVCPAATYTLTETTTGTHTWSSASTATATINSSTGAVTGIASGTVTISYNYTLICTNSAQTVITVNPVTTGTITGTDAGTLCMGSTVTLSGAPSGGTWSSSLTTRATAGSSTGVVTGVAAGTVFITYSSVNSYGCINRATTLETINATPTVGLIGGGTSAICAGISSALTEGTTGGVWSSAGTDIATVGTSGLVTGASAGTAVISYLVTSSAGCIKAVTKTVTINALPTVPDITASSWNVCPAATRTFSDSTTGGTHIWSITPTTVATVNATTGVVTGISAGTATLSYKFTLGCIGYATGILTVNPTVTVAAITGPSAVDAGSVISLSDGTSGGTWSSSVPGKVSIATTGDGTSDITGVAAGTTTVSYTIGGCGTYWALKTITVNAAKSEGPQQAANGMNEPVIYPNPTSGAFTVKTDNEGEIVIYSIEGKQIAMYTVHTGLNALRLPENIASGMYMCKFKGNDGLTAIIRLIYEQ